MFSIITDLSMVGTDSERNFEIESENLESLLVNFLSELIYLHEVENEFYQEFEVDIIENEVIRLEASVRGEKIDLDRHDVDTAVKAVSYHELSINPDGEVSIILDI